MPGLRVLITSFRCSMRTGVEVYVRDLAIGLLRLGHTPIIYAPHLGELAEEIRNLTIPVVDDLNAIGAAPDIIHGHHHIETMTALLRFPNVPAVYFCHDWYSWLDSPPPFPRLLRYIAVDQPCYEKLIYEHAIPEERVRLLLNFVDLERFKQRPPLPAHPERALLYNSHVREDVYLAAVREACEHSGITLDVVGPYTGNLSSTPEKLIGQYDIVFARGRSALEALAVGTAVVVYCAHSVGPMVTTNELEWLLPINFGVRAINYTVSPDLLKEGVIKEIKRYDPQMAAEVSRQIRAGSHSQRALDEIVSLYQEVIAAQAERGIFDAEAEGRDAAAYLRWLSLRHKEIVDGLNNLASVRLKRRLVEIPGVGKLSHAIARWLAGAPKT